MDHIFIKIDKLLLPIAADYITHVCNCCDELVQAANAGDLKRASFTAHKMKGEGSAFGLDEVSSAGAQMMDLISENDSAGLKARAETLKVYLEQVRII